MCTGDLVRYHEWQTVFSLKEKTHLEMETHIATLKQVGMEWRVSFTIRPDGASAQHADRLPAWSNCLKLSYIMEVE